MGDEVGVGALEDRAPLVDPHRAVGLSGGRLYVPRPASGAACARETYEDSAIRLIAASVRGIPSWACWMRSSISAAARSPYFSSNTVIPLGRNSQLSISIVAAPSGWKVKLHRA